MLAAPRATEHALVARARTCVSVCVTVAMTCVQSASYVRVYILHGGCCVQEITKTIRGLNYGWVHIERA